jgi:hypothetical protein
MLISVDLPAPLVPITACTCAALQVDGHTVHRHQAAPAAGDALATQQHVAHGAPAPPWRPPARPARQPLAPLRRAGPPGPRQQRHAGDDGQAQAQVPVLGEGAKDGLGLEELLQQRKGKGADQRAAQVAQAAQDDHDQHRARQVPAQQFGVHEAVLHGEQEARQPGDAARHGEGRQLVRVGGKAGGAHALLIDRCRPARGRSASAAAPPGSRTPPPGRPA